ncbi:MAG TPA: Holliday junction resolvase RuvX [Longilinea sp.]|nr:Holliday junction resolvase RuvX [Longilinea sp.]
MEIPGRVMAVDPGEKHLGIAISDLTATIANPFIVLDHVSRSINAAAIAQLAREHDVTTVVIGQALNWDGGPTPASRRAVRLAEELRNQTDLPIVLWDESGSTQEARSARIIMGVARKKRRGHLDEIAATIILQSYLDAQIKPGRPTPEGR